MLYPAHTWKLIGFTNGRGQKKVTAILQNKYTSKIVYLRFGQKGSSTYQNTTGIGSDPTHGDSTLRANYRARHAGEGIPDRKYSPGWFSLHLLW